LVALPAVAGERHHAAMDPSPSVVDALRNAAEWLRLLLVSAGGVAIAGGAVASIVDVLRSARRGERPFSATARLKLARYLALALEFQLAADIVDSSVSPDWTKIGRLAAISTIRIALNLSLSRDMAEDRRLIRERAQEAQTPAAALGR